MTTSLPDSAASRLRLLASAVEASPSDAQTIHSALVAADIQRPSGDMSLQEEANYYADLMRKVPGVAEQPEVQKAAENLRAIIAGNQEVAAAKADIDWTLVAFIVGCLMIC